MTSPPPPRPATAASVLERLLDRGYTQAVSTTVDALMTQADRGVMAVRLQQFEQRAAELQAAGQRMTPSDPVAQALLSSVESMLQTQAAILNNGAGTAVQQGATAAARATRELALLGADGQTRALIDARWNEPDPDAVRAAVDITLRPAWSAELDKFQDGAGTAIRRILLEGLIAGRSPLDLAERMRQAITDIPLYRANTLMRTAQLTAYRSATALHQAANADLAERIVRVATLDSRICPCCLALHGTTLRPGEPVRDHHNGRCTSIMIVRGRTVNIRSGESWLRDQSPERQRGILGAGGYEQWQAGRVRLNDFVQSYSDPVFGPMVGAAPLQIALSRSSLTGR